MAYRPKFDHDKLVLFSTNVGLGLSPENAAILTFGIDRSTYYEWVSEKSRLSKRNKTDLLRAVEMGKAGIANRLVLYILKSAEAGDGKLALDFLKRLDNATYGDTSKVIGDKDNPLKVVHEGVIVMPPIDNKPIGNENEKLLRPEAKREDLPSK